MNVPVPGGGGALFSKQSRNLQGRVRERESYTCEHVTANDLFVCLMDTDRPILSQHSRSSSSHFLHYIMFPQSLLLYGCGSGIAMLCDREICY